MEDIVEAGALQKLQAVRDTADALQHAKGPGIVRPKLVLGARVQRLLRVVEETRPDPLTDLELHVTVTSIVVLLR
jgi:hypothetical protein